MNDLKSIIESDYSVKLEDDGMSMASKKIGKKDKTQVRFKSKKKDDEEFLRTVDPKYIPDEFYNTNMSKADRKKLMIKIRNRAAAQTSRNKKKMYVNQLEDVKNKVIVDYKEIKDENRRLNQGWNAMEQEISSLRSEVNRLRQVQSTTGVQSQDFACMHCGKKQQKEQHMPYTQSGTSSSMVSGSTENSTDSFDSSPMESPNILTRCAPANARSKKSFYFFMFAFAAIMMGLVTVQYYGHNHPAGGLVPSLEIPKFATNFLLQDATSTNDANNDATTDAANKNLVEGELTDD
jgi:hypothetical protein